MAIARRLKWYLDTQGVDYEVVHHAHSNSSLESARAAHLPGGRVVKCVLLEDERGYMLAIVPASCRVSFEELTQQLDRNFDLASEPELGDLFGDCEVGAVPAANKAYGIPAVIDDSLLRLPDLYFEAGDHEDLVHVSGEMFRKLQRDALHGRISRPH
jgi:Ala-tRNA(Pro) deacylase